MKDFIIFEIEIPQETFDLFISDIVQDQVFTEQMEAKCTAERGNIKVKFIIRDKSVAPRDGGDMNHGPSIKVQSPKSFVLGDGDPILIPKTKDDFAKLIHGNNKGKQTKNIKVIPDEVKLAKELTERCRQELNVIWFHPDNPKRQADAIKRIINKCPEIINIDIDDEKLSKNLKDRIERNRSKN